jgi:hypothetical protein
MINLYKKYKTYLGNFKFFEITPLKKNQLVLTNFQISNSSSDFFVGKKSLMKSLVEVEYLEKKPINLIINKDYFKWRIKQKIDIKNLRKLNSVKDDNLRESWKTDKIILNKIFTKKELTKNINIYYAFESVGSKNDHMIDYHIDDHKTFYDHADINRRCTKIEYYLINNFYKSYPHYLQFKELILDNSIIVSYLLIGPDVRIKEINTADFVASDFKSIIPETKRSISYLKNSIPSDVKKVLLFLLLFIIISNLIYYN